MSWRSPPLYCVCLFFVRVIIPFILDVRFVDVLAGVTQEEGHTVFLIHLPSAVLALIFLARRIQPFLSLVDREVEFCVLTNQSFSTCWAFSFSFLARKNLSYRDSNSRPNVRRFRGHQLNHRGDRLYYTLTTLIAMQGHQTKNKNIVVHH